MIERTLGGAHAWFTDRSGGVSAAPFDSLNLARHVDDDPAAVHANHAAVLAAIGAPDASWMQPHHVHGTTVLVVTDALRDAAEADGAATARRGVALVAIGADCAPIAIANDTACAAVHAGWRGAAAGVVAAGVAAVRALGTGPVRAVVGPCVCASHYEFGADRLGELVEQLGPDVAATTTRGAPAFDLRAAIRIAFARVDVTDVEVLDVCTVESPDHYSYRRDGVTGRHGVVVMLR
ncbi:MAG: polyphenol oxidase family protein [Acidimicrobiia bacterium]